MWIFLSLTSAFLLGFYDIFKKKSVNANAIAPVLFFSTFVSALIFLPFVLLSHFEPQWFSNGFLTNFYVEPIPLKNHLLILGKTSMVLISWAFSYSAMKNLPITVVGPVNQLRPAISLLLLLIVFQEHLSVNQWVGVVLAIVSFYLMNKSGKREGIKITGNYWTCCRYSLCRAFQWLSAILFQGGLILVCILMHWLSWQSLQLYIWVGRLCSNRRLLPILSQSHKTFSRKDKTKNKL